MYGKYTCMQPIIRVDACIVIKWVTVLHVFLHSVTTRAGSVKTQRSIVARRDVAAQSGLVMRDTSEYNLPHGAGAFFCQICSQ